MFLRNRKKFSKGLTQDRLSAVHMKKGLSGGAAVRKEGKPED